ncbi:methionyl-tRNA formyltransferase [Nitrosomonas sp.]|uniref:methionyl-tRNA formyltransferase n=1 Tax=Nitrosomonas sp. TaxID=42353 RepID=UPI001DBCA253|nr:methionyl-tRNA formyltransferase [Nitrosomonas sp.]MBX3617675.1 methionyl-tRNA formyltransferase [Nitrosomonas sp.]
MKIIFAGTPIFAAAALDALIHAGHEIVMVLTQPDRPAGRGMQMTASAVKQLAQQHHLPVLQPPSLKSDEIQMQLQSMNADVMVVAAYGLILPQAVLDIPRLGCLNIHASLLPRWRGAAPIQRAILAGDHETGITIMQMDAGLDTGDMLLKHAIAIAPDDTTQSLHDKLSLAGGRSIVETLQLLQQCKLTPIPQDESQASYAAKIVKSEAEIDWCQTAQQAGRMVRAFNPSPGAYTFFRNNLLKIWQASVILEGTGRPGEIVALGADGIVVACGSGLLRIEIVQKSGGKRIAAADFLAGNQVIPGEYLITTGCSVSAHD